MSERILIADSSEEVRDALRAPLEADGFTVTEAEDVRLALDAMHAAEHHVALVDLDLPGGGALSVLDTVKTDPELSGAAVVVLSPNRAGGPALQAIERGAIDVLRKPLEPLEAVIRTRAALRVWELQRKVLEGNERLTELAATDDLTGVLARRFIESHLRGLVAAAARHGRPLSVVMIDIDNFKDINDTHGHPVGDFVLRTAVNRMLSRLRREDLLGRYGGDELMVVLPDIDLDGAVTAAEGLRAAVAETQFKVDGELIPVTISAGAAQWQDAENEAELVERADSALYEAKAAGRNRVHGTRLVRTL